MTPGRLFLLSLFVLIGLVLNVLTGRTASRTIPDDRETNLVANMADFRERHPTASQCGSCHPEQYAEWSRSLHARSLASEGFLKSFAQYLEFVGTESRQNPPAAMACFNCHAPLLKHATPQLIRQINALVLAKEIKDLDGFEVGCVACHSDGSGAFSGPIASPRDNPFHASKFSTSYKEASFCAGCHTWTASEVPCSDVYTGWKESRAAKQGSTCQSCHMAKRRGIAAAQGPPREIHSHLFPGARSPAMLQQAVVLRLGADFIKNHLQVTATVRNLTPHRLPDG